MNTNIDITDHDSALAFLMGCINYEQTPRMPYRSRGFKLQRMQRLLQLLGDPHHGLPAVHIAGTKGKGSTAVMIDSVLRAAGYRTGLYTSPHLERIEERFSLAGRPCNRATLVDLTQQVQQAVRRFMEDAGNGAAQSPPTYFEITTAMAMLLFAQQNVDVAILEVGLGGRLDSTNVCRPLVSVITNISLDHTQQLGTTVAAIAREKAGIIKPGVPLVSGAVDGESSPVIAEIAEHNDCAVTLLDSDFGFAYRPSDPRSGAANGGETPPGQFDFWIQTESGRREQRNLALGLPGRHQAANAAVALATLSELGRHGFETGEAELRRGLVDARCAARIEVLSHRPAVVLDAAHNVASAQALVDVLCESFANRRDRTLILATSRDKDARGMLRVLLPHFDRVVFTRYADNPRAADPQQLVQVARLLAAQLQQASHAGDGPELVVCPLPSDAIANFCAFEDPDALVCVAGSFFLAAQLRPLLREAVSATRQAGVLTRSI